MEESDTGYFFNAPDNVVEAHPHIEPVTGYAELQGVLEGHLGS